MNQKPGWSSSVMAAPPTSGRRSRISVLQPGLGEVGAVGQAVVAAADDDGVVGPVAFGRRAFLRAVVVIAQAVLRSGL